MTNSTTKSDSALQGDPLLLARELISHGIPVFTVPPGTAASKLSELDWSGCGGWQRYPADLSFLDYTPSSALLMRTGEGVDAVDIDLAARSELASEIDLLRSFDVPIGGVFQTARGFHLLIPSSGTQCSSNKEESIDFRGVTGCLRIPPTVRPYYGGRRHQVLMWPDFDILARDAGRVRDYLRSRGLLNEGGDGNSSEPAALMSQVLTRSEKQRLTENLKLTIKGRAQTSKSQSEQLFFVVKHAQRLNLPPEKIMHLAEQFCVNTGFDKFDHRPGGLSQEVLTILGKESI